MVGVRSKVTVGSSVSDNYVQERMTETMSWGCCEPRLGGNGNDACSHDIMIPEVTRGRLHALGW